jgi:hypothetical protein
VGFGISALIDAVDNGCALFHVMDRRLRQIEHSMDISAERAFPFLVGNVLDRAERSLMRGVIDEYVDAA